MHWIFIALVTPIAHGLVNHIDKHLLSKYFKGGEVGSLVLFSALFAAFSLPVILIFEPAVLALSAVKMLILLLNGGALVLAYIFYFKALAMDEASRVTPIFQTIPIFGFIFGYLALREIITGNELLGAVIIFLGTILLALELDQGRIRFKKNVLLFMLGSSAIYALNGAVFKWVTLGENFWISLFWDMLGKVFVGLLIFFFVASYRKQFLTVLKENRVEVLSLNIFNEILGLLGEGATVFAVLLAPIVLVQTVGNLQPLFVFLFGIILTLLFPKSPRKTSQKRV